MNQKPTWTNETFSVEKLNKSNLETPFLLIDSNDIRDKYRKLKASLPSAKIHYAVKCNPEEEILKILASEGSGFEIASAAEARRVEGLVDFQDIIFSNPIKSVSDIQKAFNMGITKFAFDSSSEILKLANHAPGSEVFLRLSVSNEGSTIPLTKKFGAPPDEALNLINAAREHGLKVIGISFHVGSQAEDIQVWSEALRVAAQIVHLAEDASHSLTVLNLGGGFPVRYSEPVPSVQEVGETIKIAIQKYNLSHLELWLEPGRYLVAEAGIVGSTIVGDIQRGQTRWLYLDVGRFNCFTELFESEDIRYPVLSSKDTNTVPPQGSSTTALTGPTCDSFDTIYTDAVVNSAVQEGDRLYFCSAGAYTHVYGSTFNDFPIPKVVVV